MNTNYDNFKTMLTRLTNIRSKPGKLIALGVVALIAGLGTITLLASHAQTPGTPFAANSFWNTPLPASTPVDPNTAAYVSWIQKDLTAYSGNGEINTQSYTPAIYTVPSGGNTTNFKFNDCQGKGYTPTDLLSQLVNVPVPSYAQPSAGTDQEMVIYQPSSDTLWETWGTVRKSDGWYACWGGRITNVSTSSGVFTSPYGVTASGLPFLGGNIRTDELKSGVINHVVGLSIIRTGSRNTASSSNDTSFTNSFVWPADRYDGYTNDNNAPVEGTRFRLDPSLNVDALNITPTAKAIAKAAQQYGIVLWDTSGVVGFRADNAVEFTSQGQTNPYDAIFGSTPSYQQLAGFPWDKLQVLPAGYGKTGQAPAPTPSLAPTPTPTPQPAYISQTNNLVTGKTWQSCNDASAYPVTNVNDGVELTRWISNPGDNCSLSTDLGKSYILSKVSILWAGDTTKNYTVQTSLDNSNWTTVSSKTTSNSSPELVDSAIANVAARYVRILTVDRWNNTYGNSIYEIGIYGSLATAPTPTPTPTPTPSVTATPTPTPAATPTPTPISTCTVSGDVNCDGHVNSRDLAILLGNWGRQSGVTRAQGDLNGDGKVSSSDLAILGNWGK
jgi:cell division septation protein DedD